MLKFKSKFYHCNHCKKILQNVEDLYFVEDGGQRGFCSEACIEHYFSPLVKNFENIDTALRKDLAIADENLEAYLDSPQYFDRVLVAPDEIWKMENDLKEELYSFILAFKKDEKPVYLIALCLVFNHRPSFVFLMTVTQSEKYLDEYRFGTKIQDTKQFLGQTSDFDQPHNFDPETLMSIDRKKSFLLSELLASRKDSDISYEQFPLYIDFFEETMRTPDEIYSYVDDDGDTMYTYMKVHDHEGVPFFYFSLCLMMKLDNGQDAVVPVLSFPTIDPDLTQIYKKGDLVSGVTKN